MIKIQNNKRIYTLEERTYQFAKSVRIFCKELSKSLLNSDDIKQLIRSSGSIGANYVEANESLSKKDFLMRVKISRKEAKESIYWLRLISETEQNINQDDVHKLINEATELLKILSSIIEKCK
jgi:four helix bundle protein